MLKSKLSCLGLLIALLLQSGVCSATVAELPETEPATQPRVSAQPAGKTAKQTTLAQTSDARHSAVKADKHKTAVKQSASKAAKQKPSAKQTDAKQAAVTLGRQPTVRKEAGAKDDKKQTNTKGASLLMQKDGKYFFAGTELPADYRSLSIFGEPELAKSQAVAYIKQTNPKPQLACSVEELVSLYWEEAEREQVRPDLALAQSLVETGTYGYGGDVQHHQNNFCGLGTTGGGVRGAAFATPQLGVRAHIQHLLAYAQQQPPSTPIIDPRYDVAHKLRLERGVIDSWYGLNGTWAMGSMYCEKIMATYQKMLALPRTEPLEPAKTEPQPKQERSAKQRSMKERVQELLHGDK